MTPLRLAIATTLTGALLTGCGGYAGPLPAATTPLPTAGPTEGGQNVVVPTDAGIATPSVPSGTPTATRTVAATATSTGCPSVAFASYVSFTASTKIRSAVNSFRVTLTQGTLSRTAWTPADPAHPHGIPVARGSGRTSNGSYIFSLGFRDRTASLAGAWRPGVKTTILIEGLGSDGRGIYQLSQHFTFDTYLPNGKGCPPDPGLRYSTELQMADQIGPIKAPKH